MKTLIFASSNLGKSEEIETFLIPYNIQIQLQSHHQVSDVPETGLSFIENALIKARNCAMITNKPTISDDSGLCVKALNNSPGIYSARYAKNEPQYKHAYEKLLYKMKDIPINERQAFFVSAMVFLRNALDPMPIIVQKTWKGSILYEAKGIHGFGYDPVFHVPSHNCSAAEIIPKIKNNISHRAQALKQLIPQILTQI